MEGSSVSRPVSPSTGYWSRALQSGGDAIRIENEERTDGCAAAAPNLDRRSAERSGPRRRGHCLNIQGMSGNMRPSRSCCCADRFEGRMESRCRYLAKWKRAVAVGQALDVRLRGAKMNSRVAAPPWLELQLGAQDGLEPAVERELVS